jgi:hypothetical protein
MAGKEIDMNIIKNIKLYFTVEQRIARKIRRLEMYAVEERMLVLASELGSIAKELEESR